MHTKRLLMSKWGLVCSTATFLLVSGCSIWQEEGPERYGLAPGPKRIPAMNPGGKMANADAPAALQMQQANMAGQAPMAMPPMAPPMAYAPPPQPYATPQMGAYAAAPTGYYPTEVPAMSPPVAGYAQAMPMPVVSPPPVIQPPVPTAPVSMAQVSPVQSPPVQSPPVQQLSASEEPQTPFDLTSTSLDRNATFPSLSRVPQAPALSAERVTSAQAAANELQQELNQNNAQRMSADQQMIQDGMMQDGLPWNAQQQVRSVQQASPILPPASELQESFNVPASVATSPSVAPSHRNMSLEEIDNRFGGKRTPAIAPEAELAEQAVDNSALLEIVEPLPQYNPPPSDMVALSPSYDFPSPDAPKASLLVSEPAPLPELMVESNAELPPIKLVPPSDAFDDEGTVALDVPPVKERFVSEPPSLPIVEEDVYVPAAPVIASASNNWDGNDAPSASPIVLTPPPEVFAERAEGYLPESRYEERRRFQRRKARF